MISGNREQLWFDRQIGSVRVSRIASVCREPDTASCPRHSSVSASTLEIMTFTGDSLSRIEISQSHVIGVSQFFCLLPLQTKITCDRANARQSLAIQIPGPAEQNSVLRVVWKVQKSLWSIVCDRFATSFFAVRGSSVFCLLVRCTSIKE